MVMVSMPFESNAGVAPWSAGERPSMRNRLLVLANGLQETARSRKRSPASAPPSSGPITGIACRESSRAVRLAPGEENLRPIYFLFDGVRTVSSFETSCARSADLSLSRFSRLRLIAGKSLAPDNSRRDHSDFPRSKERRNCLCCSGIFPTTVLISHSLARVRSSIETGSAVIPQLEAQLVCDRPHGRPMRSSGTVI
jgi:hypothetical protein